MDSLKIENWLFYFVYEERPIPELLLESNTADVVVIDLADMEPVLRTKTNCTPFVLACLISFMMRFALTISFF